MSILANQLLVWTRGLLSIAPKGSIIYNMSLCVIAGIILVAFLTVKKAIEKGQDAKRYTRKSR
jgi:hypothetical protein